MHASAKVFTQNLWLVWRDSMDMFSVLSIIIAKISPLRRFKKWVHTSTPYNAWSICGGYWCCLCLCYSFRASWSPSLPPTPQPSQLCTHRPLLLQLSRGFGSSGAEFLTSAALSVSWVPGWDVEFPVCPDGYISNDAPRCYCWCHSSKVMFPSTLSVFLTCFHECLIYWSTDHDLTSEDLKWHRGAHL